MADHQNDSSREQYSHDMEIVRRVGHKLEAAAISSDPLNIHIISRIDGWIVKREGAKKSTRIGLTRAQAIQVAKEMIEKGTANSIIIHAEDGTVARRIS